MEKCKTAREWFEIGKDVGASYLIIFYDLLEKEHRPNFVFPEQDIEFEVIKLTHKDNIILSGIVYLFDNIKSIDLIFRPTNMVTSRVEN